MADTPQFGSMVFVGLRTRKTYVKDVYFADTVAAQIRWDAGSGASATSEQNWTPPEPVVLTDFAIVTGTVSTTKIQLTRNAVPTGDYLRYVIHLTSLNQRPRLAIGFNAGSKIGAIQQA